MRDIKFRAWLPDESRMINPVIVLKFSPQNETIAWYEDMADAMDGRLTDTFMDKTIIMQYTGLKDVNGKEVYEGDVLLDFFTGDYYEVIWDDIGAMFLFSNTDTEKGKNGAIDYYEFEDECRGLGFAVAGNVYEHPDLGRTAIESTESAE